VCLLRGTDWIFWILLRKISGFQRALNGSGCYSPSSHCVYLGSIRGRSMCDMCWTKWHWDRNFSQCFCQYQSTTAINPPLLSTHHCYQPATVINPPLLSTHHCYQHTTAINTPLLSTHHCYQPTTAINSPLLHTHLYLNTTTYIRGTSGRCLRTPKQRNDLSKCENIGEKSASILFIVRLQTVALADTRHCSSCRSH
jgi:hypothetical protein